MAYACFDVVCLGGPHNGHCVEVPAGRQTWEVWRPVWLPSGLGQELMGSYIVDPDRICATWVSDLGFSNPTPIP